MTTDIDNLTLSHHTPIFDDATVNQALSVGIIGGGVAGATIAIRLAALGVQVHLFEKKSSLIDGPPMCHLHAGGNLYREIPDEDCIALLEQSIDILRLYPYSIDVRPTLFAIPTRDAGNPQELLPRLELLTDVYRDLIKADPDNKVLGDPDDYYKLYERCDLEHLIQHNNSPSSLTLYQVDDWVANAAKQLDLDKLKYPVIAVNEYGWNIFRLAASAKAALDDYPNVQVNLNTQVGDIQCVTPSSINTSNAPSSLPKWLIKYQKVKSNNHSPLTDAVETNAINDEVEVEVDYLVNACGFRVGVIDDMVGVTVQRMVEFKASYVTYWDKHSDKQSDEGSHTDNSQAMADTLEDADMPTLGLPEIIIHGRRGTPQGMVQLTPYPKGYYQIHSMDKEVTLFDDGLVAATSLSAQPQLNKTYIDYIDKGWAADVLDSRSQKAIERVSEFVPRFASAKPTGNALYGGQQIPGNNDTLRVADISLYSDISYARAENVKASSALLAADEVVRQLESDGLLTISDSQRLTRKHHRWHYLSHVNHSKIDQKAQHLTKQRGFPLAMAGVINPYTDSVK